MAQRPTQPSRTPTSFSSLPYAIGRYGALSQDAADGWNDACGQDPLAMASWGANYGRLRELKAKYDPANLFRINHNIEPRLK